MIIRYSVWGSDATHVYVGGQWNTMLFWDGSTKLQVTNAPSAADFKSIYRLDSTHIFAVGAPATSPMANGPRKLRTNELFSITFLIRDSVFTVGLFLLDIGAL